MPKINRAAGSNHKNYILASLPAKELQELDSFMQTIQLKSEDKLYRAGEAFENVYLPTTAMLTWIATTSEGERVEVGIVGWEGIVGVPELQCYKISSFSVEAELPGEAIRISADRFRRHFEKSPILRDILLRYSCVAMMQLAQSSVCNRFHDVEQRMCRWLLMAHDRCDGDELNLTQEILAGMIGARRPAVSIVIGNLQRVGLIRAERGRVTIINRDAIEKTACECYRVIREAFDRFVKEKLTI